MNKAFTKEPESSEGECPRCGAKGVSVGRETLEYHLPADALTEIAESAYFCATPHCEVAYFDIFDRIVPVERMLHPVYPKDLEAPLCPCFEFTREDVEKDVQEGVPTRIRALLAKSKSPEAHCVSRSPSGQCCMPEVQRYYMKLRSATG